MALGRYNLDPYGLKIISAYLKQHGHEADLLFLPFTTWEEHEFSEDIFDPKQLQQLMQSICQFILNRQPQLLGLSVLTNFYEHAAVLSDELKRHSSVPIIWGGTHATVDPEGTLEHADMVCLGEGEDAILELANKMAAGENYDNVANIWLKRNGQIIRNDVRPLTNDLDRLPYPDLSLENQFVLHKGQILPLDHKLALTYLPHNFGWDSIGYSVVATRGCPYRCTYCFNYGLRSIYRKDKGSIVRRRSLENVMSELYQIKQQFPELTHINIADETFILGDDLAWIKEFCRMYKSRIGLPFFCCLRPENISQESVSELVDAGCFFVQMGIQSGSPRTLKEVYHRHMNMDLLVEKAKVLNLFKDKLMPCYDVILDNPYETDEDLRQTLDFLLRLPKPFRIQLFSLTLYPGTQLYDRAKQDGKLKDIHTQVYQKSYEAYDTHNYYNLLISLTPFWPEKWLKYLKARRDPFHKWALIWGLQLWEYRNKFSSTWPYKVAKKVITKLLNITPPAAEVSPTKAK